MPFRSARFPGPIGSIGSRKRTEKSCNAAHPVYSRRERATRILSPGVSNTSTDARFRKPRMLRSEAPKPGAAGRKDLATEDLPRIRRDTTRKKGRVKRKIWRGCEFFERDAKETKNSHTQHNRNLPAGRVLRAHGRLARSTEQEKESESSKEKLPAIAAITAVTTISTTSAAAATAISAITATATTAAAITAATTTAS